MYFGIDLSDANLDLALIGYISCQNGMDLVVKQLIIYHPGSPYVMTSLMNAPKYSITH